MLVLGGNYSKNSFFCCMKGPFERVQKLCDISKTPKLDQKHIYVIKVDFPHLKFRKNLTGGRYEYKDSKLKRKISIRGINLTYYSIISVFIKSKSNSQSQ